MCMFHFQRQKKNVNPSSRISFEVRWTLNSGKANVVGFCQRPHINFWCPVGEVLDLDSNLTDTNDRLIKDTKPRDLVCNSFEGK